MFNSKSGLVKIWVCLIKEGIYNISDIPDLHNLKNIIEIELNK